MAWQLVKEVLDGAPPSLKAPERLVLVAIAEWCDVETRTCWRLNEELRLRVNMTASGLRAAFARLAAVGADPRVPIAFAADGAPVYAYKGRTTTFRLPYMTAVDGHEGDTTATPSEGDTTASPSAREGDTTAAPLNTPAPVSNSSTGDTAVAALADAKATPQHAKATPQRIKGDTTVAPSPSKTKRNQFFPREQAPSYPQLRAIN